MDWNRPKLSETWEEITLLKQQIRDFDRTINLVHDAIAQNIAKGPEHEKDIRAVYELRLLHLSDLVDKKVSTFLYTN